MARYTTKSVALAYITSFNLQHHAENFLQLRALSRSQMTRARVVSGAMIRTALPSSRHMLSRRFGPQITCQWLVAQKTYRIHQVNTCVPTVFRLRLTEALQRSIADAKTLDTNTKPSIHDSDTIVLPGSQSQVAKGPTPAPPGPVPSVSPASFTPATPTTEKIIPPENMPLIPPSPGNTVPTAPPTHLSPSAPGNVSPIPPTHSPTPKSGSPPPTPPSPPKKKTGRFRRFLLYMFILGGFSFASGVYYSLVSDNFHDFFTEYIPFGEEAVLYFEEREFRRRFPRITNPTNRPAPPDSGNQITIPSKSGLSWKITEGENQGSDLASKGRHMSAVDKNPTPGSENAQRTPSTATPAETVVAVENAKKNVPSVPAKATSSRPEPKVEDSSPKKEPAKPVQKQAPGASETAKDVSTKAPEVNEPSKIMPIAQIDALKIKNAEEPLVQDLVKILNDIITVVNADNASGKYSSTINKAKSELANVGGRILALKQAEKTAADKKIQSTQAEFDTAAKELVRRLEEEMRDQEARWRDEFESEREKISNSYQERLDVELKRSQQVSEQRIRNELLEQAVTLKKDFISSIKDRVETERNGRLAKLSDLASSINELESLTSQWNSVIDSNLQAQHLQVAVEAVRTSLNTADRPRPFIHELAALKELAADNPVVNAAIASVNPTAYQRGVPTSAQLIDRFRRVAAEVRKASLLPEDAGVASHAASWALSRFLFKKRGMTVGDDVESVLTRTETLLEEGDLDGAAREMNTLDGWARKLSVDWVQEARKVLEVRQALEVCGAEVRLQGLSVN